MSAFVIPFPGKWSGTYDSAKTKQIRPGGRKRPPQIETRVGRITALLTDLEDLSPPSAEVSAVLRQARATIRQVRQRWASSVALVVEDEGDSQPHIDREALERHFQSRD